MSTVITAPKTNNSIVMLYRFVSRETGRSFEPFGLCDYHKPGFFTPPQFTLQELGISTSLTCGSCNALGGPPKNQE
jgi:hypothetical protein